MDQQQGSVMMATLGGQPQLITFALDALLARGETIREVIVLYLSAEGSRVNRALARLSVEFVNDYYAHANRPCRLRPLPIRDGPERLPDIRTDADAGAAWEMLRDLILTLKGERYHLHICVSGGRRMMGLLLTSLALLHFTPRDKLWHVYSPDHIQTQADEGLMMHARPHDGVQLVQVPLAPLGTQFPILRELTQPLPQTSRQLLGWLNEKHRQNCRQVVDSLTQRELETLKLFATGLSPQEVADRMVISLNTVNTYRKKIFELCRNTWPERQSLRYHHLRELFGPYFEE